MVVRPDHPLAELTSSAAKRLSLAQLAEFPIVTYDRAFTGRSTIDEVFANQMCIRDRVTYTAERSLGLKLPRNAAEIAQQGISVAKNELKAGDLVFFNTLGRRYSHVGIYLGDDRFVHSPSAGGVVRVENMTMAYWSKRYNLSLIHI